MGLHGSPWQGAAITLSFFIWCAVGALAGWLAGTMMQSKGKIQRLEEVLVGVFGAFIGAESTFAMFERVRPASGFDGTALAGGVAGAIVLLLLLRFMRGVVGPLRNSKSPASRRR